MTTVPACACQDWVSCAKSLDAFCTSFTTLLENPVELDDPPPTEQLDEFPNADELLELPLDDEEPQTLLDDELWPLLDDEVPDVLLDDVNAALLEDITRLQSLPSVARA